MAVTTKSFFSPSSLQVPLSQQGRRPSLGATRAARSSGDRVAQAARAWGRAAGRAREGHRSPQRSRRQGWRRPPSAAGAPTGGRSRRAPARGRPAARASVAPRRRGSPRGSCRGALREERPVRLGAKRGAQGAGRGAGLGRSHSLGSAPGQEDAGWSCRKRTVISRISAFSSLE